MKDIFSNLHKYLAISDLRLLSQREKLIEFETEAGILEISSNLNNSFRLRLNSRAKVNDYGIISNLKSNSLKLKELDGNGYLIETDVVWLELRSNPFRFSFGRGCNVLLKPSTDYFFTGKYRYPPFSRFEDNWYFSFDLDGDKGVYGFGEQHHGLNHKGHLVRAWSEDSLGVNTEQSYKNVPFFWSPRGWGVFINTPSLITHSIGYPAVSHRSYVGAVADELLDISLISGENPEQIIDSFTDISGKSENVPLWSLGLWVSRAYYKEAKDVMEAATKMREYEIPCDVIVLDGRAWQDTATRFSFDWDYRYPDPKGFISGLHNLGYKVSAWLYPLCSLDNPKYEDYNKKGMFLKNELGKTYEYEFDLSPFGKVLTPLPKSGIYDFSNPEVVRWWGSKVKELCDLGVSNIKNDFAEQVPEDSINYLGDKGKRFHNVYTMLYSKYTYEAGMKATNGDFLIWGRSGWAGSQRYPIQWVGDSQSDWGGLSASIISGLNYGLSGNPYTSSDIGGFYGAQPTDELLIRWTQYGVFSPLCRYHGVGVREPYNFSEKALRICRKFIELRYSLIFYIRKEIDNSLKRGIPLQRPMILSFYEDRLSHGFEHQYMFGDDLFVVPIVDPEGHVSFYLPKGRWFDFWGKQMVYGGNIMEDIYELDKIPLYIRYGSVIGFAPKVQTTSEFGEKKRCSYVEVYGLPYKDDIGEGYRVYKNYKKGRVVIELEDSAIELKTYGVKSQIINDNYYELYL